MNNLLKFAKDALSSDSPVSSKRIAGAIGWIVCIFCVLYLVLKGDKTFQESLDLLFYTSCALLGLDAVVSIFKK